MKDFRSLYIVLLLMVLVTCFIYFSRFMPLLLLIMLLTPLFALAAPLLSLLMLQIAVQPEGGDALDANSKFAGVKHGRFTLNIIIRNRSPFAITPLNLSLFCQVGDHVVQTLAGENIPAFSEIVVPLDYSLPFRGEYTVGLSRAVMFDFLKLFSFKKKTNGILQVLVFPREFDAEELPQHGEEAAAQPERTFAGEETYGSIREYRAGDALKHVHWKLSAKSEELIVRQTEQTALSQVTVFCDMSDYHTGSGDRQLELSDAVAEAGLAVCRAAVERKELACLFTDDQPGYAVRDISQYRRLRTTFARFPHEPAETTLPEMLRKHTDDISGELFVITGALTAETVGCLDELKLTERDFTLIVCSAVEEDLAAYINHRTKARLILCDPDDVGAALSRLAG
jgi:uncharacterized protein (DUF58 family)